MFGNTLLIINPTARNNKATAVAAKAVNEIKQALDKEPSSPTFEVCHTVYAKEGTALARQKGANFQTVIVLGGDGIVHEVVNGLMLLPKEDRPILGIIPCGNGDDFARSINMSRKPKESLQELLIAQPTSIDIVKVNDTYCDETISFGLDAAIALQTMELRKKTGRTGTSLYLQAGFNQLKNQLDVHTATVSFDDEKAEELSFYLMAIQNGKTYGGGFKICPKAELDDGYLDICYALPPLTTLQATTTFLKAKNGGHINHPHVRFKRAKKVSLEFRIAPPTQIDGEAFSATKIDIELEEKALRILMNETK